jgi:AcrR family transcriptional regulator
MVERAKKRARTRLTPEEWIRAAVEGLLKEGGAAGVRIARLARELGVTPGSFYWHFRDRNHFRDQIIRYWMTQMLRRAGTIAERGGKGAAALRALPDVLVSQRLPDLDAAMRSWATVEPAVAKAVARADELRVRRAAEMFRAAGFGEEAAALRGQLLFWNFLGSRGAAPELRLRAFKELIEVLLLKR